MQNNKNLAKEPKRPIDPKRTQEAAPKSVRQTSAGWRRPVGLISFLGIPTILLLLAGSAGYFMYQEIHRKVPERIPQQKLVEFQKKKTMLAKARTLREKGQYVESVALYDQYLQRYPRSTAARQGRSSSLAQIERPATKGPRQRTTVAVAEQRKQEPEKPSLRDRMRRIFRRRS